MANHATSPSSASSPAAAPGPAAPRRPWLVADIGGTHARFGWLEESGPEAGERAAVTHLQTLRVADHAGPVAAAQAYLAERAAQAGPAWRAPRAAAWAVAAAVVDDVVEMTNAGWRLARPEVQRSLGLDAFLLLNDFEALALSLPGLAPTQLRRIGDGAAQRMLPLGTRAVVGPGTGLGVAGLVAAPAAPPGQTAGAAATRWLALPGEGGHATLAAADDVESALLAEVRRQHPHVSAERLLSGLGLPGLHQAVARMAGAAAPALLAPDAIVAAGIATPGSAGADALCRQTLEHFCALLGGFAGNVALTLGARGGVYIGGGIVPRLGTLFEQSRFRQRFEAKGRLAPYLAAIPTWLIVDTNAALAGAATALAQHALSG
ncbi:MAG: glucokinase [Rubrivivax sp.]|nr:glucokinase [Rubrivivax sp.]